MRLFAFAAGFLVTPAAASAQPFLTWREHDLGPDPPAVGDLDGDGGDDLVVAVPVYETPKGYDCPVLTHEEVHWFRNQGQPACVTRRQATIATSGGRDVALGDLDGDGDLDVVDGGVTWYANGGDGSSWSRATIDPAGADVVWVADLDGDGAADVIAGERTSGYGWYRNLGGGAFGARTPIVGPSVGDAVRFADLDTDGDLDLVAGSCFGVAWLENLGLGVLAAEATLWTEPGPALAAGDLDEDGRVDLVAGSDTWCGRSVAWLPNLGAGAWGASASLAVDDGVSLLAVDDLDGDGHLDIVGAGYVLRWWPGSGDGTFAAPETIHEGDGGSWIVSLALAAPMGDGARDLVVTEFHDSDCDALCGCSTWSGSWWESHPCVSDTDGDGVCDDRDACLGDDLVEDFDADGVCGAADACWGEDGWGNTDGDLACDDCDLCPLDAPDDSDDDDVCDSVDACPGADDGADADLDLVADACDPCPLDRLDDSDGDGVCDSGDACPGADDRADADLDLAADACDPCPLDRLDDSDGDGVCDSEDACPGAHDRADADLDLVPDACDPCPLDHPDDSDGDGVCDSDERTLGAGAEDPPEHRGCGCADGRPDGWAAVLLGMAIALGARTGSRRRGRRG